jgi:acyl dehydratase
VDGAAARTAGLPGAYDLGAARQSALIQSITHGVGDHAWLRRNACEYRRFVYVGDVMRFRNVVARKFVDADGEHCIELDGATMNQRGENVMPARSIVALPSRAEASTPAGRRARRAAG